MNVVFYSFTKKKESTKQPSASGTTYDCSLIEGTSVLAPAIKILAPSGVDITSYNYAYIADFGRYYFVTDITYDITTFTVHLTVDVLASAKTEIGSSSHFVERCASEFDGTIVDALYPQKADPQLTIVEPAKINQVTPTIFGTPISPSFIVGIIGAIAPANASIVGNCYNGSVVYFCLTQDQLGKLLTYLLDSVSLYQVPQAEMSDALQKQLLNPIQYIHSIKCVPFNPNVDQQYVATKFYLGFDYLDVPNGESWKICKAPTIGELTIDNGYMEKRVTELKLPLNPEYATRGKWVLGQPSSRYVFDVQPFGQFEIPSANLLSAQIVTPPSGDPYINLMVTTVFDISSGECTLFLNFGGSSDVSKAFYKITKNCAVPVPVHQSVQDAMSFRQYSRELNFEGKSAVSSFINMARDVANDSSTGLGALLSTGAELVTGGEGIKNRMMNTIDSATQANQVIISGSGNEGSYMSFNKDLCVPRVWCYFFPHSPENNAERGKPLCDVRQINTLSGYIKCSGAEIETSLTAQENSAIQSFLNGGFYYE